MQNRSFAFHPGKQSRRHLFRSFDSSPDKEMQGRRTDHILVVTGVVLYSSNGITGTLQLSVFHCSLRLCFCDAGKAVNNNSIEDNNYYPDYSDQNPSNNSKGEKIIEEKRRDYNVVVFGTINFLQFGFPSVVFQQPLQLPSSTREFLVFTASRLLDVAVVLFI